MKITVICRVEPGCLGPHGADHVEDFCHFAQKEFDLVDPTKVDWQIEPRFDKTLSEIQYKLKNRNLSSKQAGLYLDALGKEQDAFEETLFKQLAESVSHYMAKGQALNRKIAG